MPSDGDSRRELHCVSPRGYPCLDRLQQLSTGKCSPGWRDVVVGDRLLTPLEVAQRLSVSRSMIYMLIQRGEMPAVYIGRLPRVTEDGLRLYLASAKRSGGEPNGRPTTPEHGIQGR